MTNQNLIRLKLLAALVALVCGIGAIVTVYELYQATPPATSAPPASPAAAPAAFSVPTRRHWSRSDHSGVTLNIRPLNTTSTPLDAVLLARSTLGIGGHGTSTSRPQSPPAPVLLATFVAADRGAARSA